MDVIQLIIRLVSFGVSLFVLLEFVVFCKVDTIKASMCLFTTVFLVLFLFISLKRYNMTMCKECHNQIPHHILPKNMFKSFML